MNKFWMIIIVAMIGILSSYSEGKCFDLPLNQTIGEGGELRIPFDNNKIKRVSITIQNLLDQESVIYRSEFMDGNERPENEIGPKFIRTHALDPKISDENADIRTDRKTIVLDTGNMNEIYLKVEKGQVAVEITEEKKRM